MGGKGPRRDRSYIDGELVIRTLDPGGVPHGLFFCDMPDDSHVEGTCLNGCVRTWMRFRGDTMVEWREYAQGAAHGLWRTYYADGRLRSECPYEEGMCQGLVRHWWEDTGELAYEQEWVGNRPHGVARCWFPSGLPWSEGAFRNGARDGRWVTHDESGAVVMAVEWSGGVPAQAGRSPVGVAELWPTDAFDDYYPEADQQVSEPTDADRSSG